jgi:thymidine kinase
MGVLREEASIDNLLGFLISYSSTVMNSGKTRNLTDDRTIAKVAGFNVRTFSHSDNERDGKDCIRVNEGSPIPALSVASPLDIITEVEKLDSLLSAEPKSPGDKHIDTTGESYFVGRPVEVVLVDEGQLFTLNYEGTRDMLSLVDYCRQKGKVLAISSLLENARQEPFGNIYEVHRRAQHKRPTSARCKMERQDHICGRSAIHTTKLWRLDKIEEEAIQELMRDMPYVTWWTKNDERISGVHVTAPYFAPVVEVEKDKSIPDREKSMSYVPICDDCLSAHPAPFRQEFYSVYHSIKNGIENLDIRSQSLLQAIVEDLIKDNWVESKGGLLVPVSHHKGEFGVYTPSNLSKSATSPENK